MRGKSYHNVLSYAVIGLAIVIPLLIFASVYCTVNSCALLERAASYSSASLGFYSSAHASSITPNDTYYLSSPSSVIPLVKSLPMLASSNPNPGGGAGTPPDQPALPSGVKYYVPLRISAPSDTDQYTLYQYAMLIKVPVQAFNQYIRPDARNVEFFDFAGNVFYSWYQGLQDSSSVPGGGKYYEFWIKVPPRGEPNPTTIYMGIGGLSVNLMDGATVGEAPQLSYNSGLGWAHYDNGGNVFWHYVSSNWDHVFSFSSSGTWSGVSNTGASYADPYSNPNGPFVQEYNGTPGSEATGATAYYTGPDSNYPFSNHMDYIVEMLFDYPPSVQKDSRLGLVTLSTASNGAVYGYRFLLGGYIDTTCTGGGHGHKGKCTDHYTGGISFLNDPADWVGKQDASYWIWPATYNNEQFIMQLRGRWVSDTAAYDSTLLVTRSSDGYDGVPEWSYPDPIRPYNYAQFNYTEYYGSAMGSKNYNSANAKGNTAGYIGISAQGPKDTQSEKMTVYWFRIRHEPYPIFSATFESFTPISTTTIPVCYSSPCYISNTINSITTFGGAGGAGSGSITHNPATPTASVPLIKQILDKNSASAQWLLTCPSPPNPSFPLEYLTNTSYYILGNRCLADSSPLKTTASLESTVTWSSTSPASATYSLQVSDASRTSVQNLAYSGATNVTGGYQFNISNGYDSYSYIFDQVPPAVQHGVWTWSSEYANLSKLNTNGFQLPFFQYLTVNKPFSATVATTTPTLTCNPPQVYCRRQDAGTFYTQCEPNAGSCSADGGSTTSQPTSSTSTTYQWTCQYPYTYALQVSMESFLPLNIPIPLSATPAPPGGSTLTMTTPGGKEIIFSLHSGDAPFDSSKAKYGTATVGPNIFDCSGYLLSPDEIDVQHAKDWCGVPYKLISSSAFVVDPYGTVHPCSGSHDNYCLGSHAASNQHTLYVWQDPSDTTKYWLVYREEYIYAYQPNCDDIFYQGHTACNSGPLSLYAFWSGYVNVADGKLITSAQLKALPYMLYNVSLPATATSGGSVNRFMNLSMDIYSLQNLQSPATQLDGLPLTTDSGVLSNYGSTLAQFPSDLLDFANPNPSDMSPTLRTASSLKTDDTRASWVFGLQGTNSQSDFGSYASGIMPKAVAMSASPTDDVYVLTNATDQAAGPLILDLRAIPSGYYNISNDQPTSVTNAGIHDDSTWFTTWNSYWFNTVTEQSANLYLTDVFNLKSTLGGMGGDPQGLALASDYNGDVFAATTSGSGAFQLAEFTHSGNLASAEDISMPTGFMPSSMAVSPGGDSVYVTNALSGYINIYSAPGFTYQGSIPLSYSSAGGNFNIENYLLAGGPYHDRGMSADIGSEGYSADKPYLYEDTSSNHHPIAISDYRGFIYVLDEWAFPAPTDNPTAYGDALMLRVFYANGTEVPISGYPQSTYTSAQTGGAASGSGYTPAGGWPPYGWMLSANFTYVHASVDPSKWASTTYCLIGCNSNQAVLANDPYKPIGPSLYLLNILSYYTSFPSYAGVKGMSVDFNGTVYMLLQSFSPDAASRYTELLKVGFNLMNYTTVSYGGRTPYVCYANASSPAPAFPCITSDTFDSLREMRPPLLGFPSSFAYLESQGAPERFLSATNQFSQVTNQGSNIQHQATTTTSTVGSTTTVDYSALQGSAGAPGSGSAFNPSQMYANSIISGYVLVPYKASYIATQTWNSVGDGTVVSGTPAPGQTACPSYTFPQPTAAAYTIYTATKDGFHSNYLNDTIEGGSLYAKYVPGGNLYIANVSDKDLIMLPRIAYTLLSNRLFGAVYFNQTLNTIEALAGTENPLVINSIGIYSYKENDFNQSAFGHAYPAFSLQEAVPAGSTGANCGGSCPPNYYYSPASSKHVAFPSLAQYSTSTQTGYVQLIDLYDQASRADSLMLDLNQSHVLGYNRLIYTYVDRFNNTISMPLDVDLANTVSLDTTAIPTIYPDNSNQTSITVNGVAYAYTTTDVKPLANADIYLYYDSNINYYNSTHLPSYTQTADSDAYISYALNCAFAPTGKECELANPLSTSTQSPAGYVTEANQILYSPQYNSISENTCSPQTKSLLVTPNFAECNIYGAEGLSASRYINGHYEYCVPYFFNGTGAFTSQLGLVAILKTAPDGSFRYTFDACGTGEATVMAQYYGDPPPQPFTALQTYLGEASSLQFSSIIPASEQQCLNDALASGDKTGYMTCRTKYQMPEYSYTTGPASSLLQTLVGNFALGIGDISAYTVAAATALLVLFALHRSRKLLPRRPKSGGARGIGR